jgi:hypothetical protein
VVNTRSKGNTSHTDSQFDKNNNQNTNPRINNPNNVSNDSNMNENQSKGFVTPILTSRTAIDHPLPAYTFDKVDKATATPTVSSKLNDRHITVVPAQHKQHVIKPLNNSFLTNYLTNTRTNPLSPPPPPPLPNSPNVANITPILNSPVQRTNSDIPLSPIPASASQNSYQSPMLSPSTNQLATYPVGPSSPSPYGLRPRSTGQQQYSNTASNNAKLLVNPHSPIVGSGTFHDLVADNPSLKRKANFTTNLSPQQYFFLQYTQTNVLRSLAGTGMGPGSAPTSPYFSEKKNAQNADKKTAQNNPQSQPPVSEKISDLYPQHIVSVPLLQHHLQAPSSLTLSTIPMQSGSPLHNQHLQDLSFVSNFVQPIIKSMFTGDNVEIKFDHKMENKIDVYKLLYNSIIPTLPTPLFYTKSPPPGLQPNNHTANSSSSSSNNNNNNNNNYVQWLLSSYNDDKQNNVEKKSFFGTTQTTPLPVPHSTLIHLYYPYDYGTISNSYTVAGTAGNISSDYVLVDLLNEDDENGMAAEKDEQNVIGFDTSATQRAAAIIDGQYSNYLYDPTAMAIQQRDDILTSLANQNGPYFGQFLRDQFSSSGNIKKQFTNPYHYLYSTIIHNNTTRFLPWIVILAPPVTTSLFVKEYGLDKTQNTIQNNPNTSPNPDRSDPAKRCDFSQWLETDLIVQTQINNLQDKTCKIFGAYETNNSPQIVSKPQITSPTTSRTSGNALDLFPAGLVTSSSGNLIDKNQNNQLAGPIATAKGPSSPTNLEHMVILQYGYDQDLPQHLYGLQLPELSTQNKHILFYTRTQSTLLSTPLQYIKQLSSSHTLSILQLHVLLMSFVMNKVEFNFSYWGTKNYQKHHFEDVNGLAITVPQLAFQNKLWTSHQLVGFFKERIVGIVMANVGSSLKYFVSYKFFGSKKKENKTEIITTALTEATPSIIDNSESIREDSKRLSRIGDPADDISEGDEDEAMRIEQESK